MKKFVVLLSALALMLALGCQKQDRQLAETVAKLEQRVDALEKRLSAPPTPKEPPKQAQAYDLPVGDSKVLGKLDAPVTLTVFSDYECPFCARADEGLIVPLMKDPELSKIVKVVHKQFPLPFHEHAEYAAMAALAAGLQGRGCFWGMTHALYKSQKDLSQKHIKTIAGTLKCEPEDGKGEKPLNAAQWEEAMKTKKDAFKKEIDADMKLGSEVAKIRGTPSIFINGWELEGRSLDGVKQLIKEKNMVPPPTR